MLSNMQQKIYDYIAACIHEQGYPPSVREIGEAVGLKSPSTVHFHLKKLADLGVIEIGAGKGRAISLTHPAPASAPPSGYRPPRHGVRLPAHHRPAPGTKTASLNHRKNFFCSRRPQRRGFSAFLSRPQRQTSLRGLAADTALHYGGTS